MDIKATPYSSLKIFAHPEKIAALKKGERTAPIYIRIKPTNVCNHHCYYCSYADEELALRDNVNPRDQIDWGKLQETIADIAEIGVKAVTFSGGGEPLVYPNIVAAMNAILSHRIDLSIITNGQLLTGERAEILAQAKWVRISCDSADREAYARIRGIPPESFDKVCENISRFAGLKKPNCELGINFVVNHQNCHQIYQAAKLVNDLGVNHIKFTARVTKELENYHKPFKQAVINQIHKAQADFSRPGFKIINKYESDFDSCTIFQRSYSFCGIKELFAVIAADSKVYFCHDKAYVKTGIVGDLTAASFKDLWFSEAVIARYRGFDAQKECCHHCVYDDRNILINDYLALDENHINFI
jgi:MoaA/NifB/PqqE/SkfB family radical SAM enzyme